MQPRSNDALADAAEQIAAGRAGFTPTLDACDAIDLREPYAPDDWPIESPIVYVQGDADPATPIAGARAHFDAQQGTDRTFVTVHGIGHTPLQWRISEGCGSRVWEAILADEDLEAALADCGVEATVEQAPAE